MNFYWAEILVLTGGDYSTKCTWNVGYQSKELEKWVKWQKVASRKNILQIEMLQQQFQSDVIFPVLLQRFIITQTSTTWLESQPLGFRKQSW